MTLASRALLAGTGLALAAGAIAAPRASTAVLAQDPQEDRQASGAPDGWDAVRAQFALSEDYVHMSAMLIASHPKPVREAIETYRRGLDANPITYLHENNRPLQEA